jgi:tetratricopeptide (TPR) repeat protein
MVVPPEAPSSSSELAWIGEVVADQLPQALAFLGVPTVTRDDRLAAQEALDIPRVLLTRATNIRIAEALGASRMVLGSFTVEGETLDLSLRVLDVERGSVSAPFIAEGPLDQIADTIDRLAWDIALSGPTPPARERRDELRQRRSEISFEALKTYAQGLAATDAPSQRKLLTRALSLHSRFDAARLALGRLQMESREFSAAQDTLSRIPADSLLHRQGRFLRGIALVELGRYRDAAASFAGLAAEEETPAVLNNQAIAMLRSGAKPPAASSLLRRAADRDPSSADIEFNLGWVLLNEGDPDAAAFWLRGVVRDEPRDSHAQLVLTWALRKAGRTEEADREWKTLAALVPSYESLVTLDLTRRFERILPTERALQLDRESRNDAQKAASLVAEAERLVGAGDIEAAIRELTRAIYLDAHQPRAHRLLARIHHDRGDGEQAIAELRMSLWSREDLEVRLELASVLKEAGRTAEARAEAERVLKADPENAAAREFLEKL